MEVRRTSCGCVARPLPCGPAEVFSRWTSWSGPSSGWAGSPRPAGAGLTGGWRTGRRSLRIETTGSACYLLWCERTEPASCQTVSLPVERIWRNLWKRCSLNIDLLCHWDTACLGGKQCFLKQFSTLAITYMYDKNVLPIKTLTCHIENVLQTAVLLDIPLNSL